ncbi:MerR family transcriptional regulator [Lactobacillus kullabergensis]|uniref:MerR family transcriptional regulator n=1 Tax=Lactobacillus kullabergensis TaxID=1218493 RepID=A0A0F4LHZ4_9LACO|nr:MerR family transcriptional regulator [Lactobacillus kullabergensis]KJY58215.1 MerR family transcriptional regulator [Lactobacillus kullabergensis]
MSYSINELAKLAGISTRTLRYYDKQGLLKARRNPENNYRYYEESEVDQLQKILFLKLFDLPLEQIKQVMQTSSETQYQVLRNQRGKLVAREQYLDDLIRNLDKTLATMKGEAQMTDTEKFATLKTEIISKNEKQYGREIRKKYGDAQIDLSNEKFNSLSADELSHFKKLSAEILTELKNFDNTAGVKQAADKHLFDLHKEYLLTIWPKGQYSAEAHKNLAQMYVCDPRFSKYYEEATGNPDAAKILKAIIDYYA